MADDITARILLSVEYADAVQKCKEVEVGITEVTEARGRDVEATKTTKSTSTSNARAMEKEAEAAKKVAKATKEKAEAQLSYEEAVRQAAKSQGMTEDEWRERAKRNAESSAKAQADFNRKFNERMSAEEAKAADSANPERSAAIEELKERKSVMREVQLEQSRMAKIANADLDEEIKDQRILVAEMRKRLAIEKEIVLQRKLNDVRDQLNDPNVRKDPQKVNDLTKLREKYERQSTFNSQEILTAEQNLRRLKNPVKEVNKQVGKSTSVFGKAAQGIGRSISAVARIGGRGMGMEIPTEGLQGRGGRFIAASAAIAGVSMLARGIKDLYDENRTARIESDFRNMEEIGRTSERLKQEYNERMSNIATLREFNSVEKLNNVQRVKQAHILETLNSRLDGMSIEVDKASGKIKNLGSIEEKQIQKDTSERLSMLQQELQQAMKARSQQEKFLSEATAFTQLYDMEGIKEASAAEQKLSARILELQKEIGTLNKSMTKGEQGKRWDLRNAALQDEISKDTRSANALKKQVIEEQKSLRFNGDIEKQEAEDRKINADRLAALQKSFREVEKRTNELKADYIKTTKGTEESNKALEKYRDSNKQKVQLEKDIAAETLKSITWQKKDIEIAKKKEQEEKAAREGITRSISGIVGRESYKVRQTSTAAIMANSLEGLRMQNRQLIANTPDVKILKETEKQSKTLTETLNAIKGMAATLSKGIKVEAKKV